MGGLLICVSQGFSDVGVESGRLDLVVGDKQPSSPVYVLMSIAPVEISKPGPNAVAVSGEWHASRPTLN